MLPRLPRCIHQRSVQISKRMGTTKNVNTSHTQIEQTKLLVPIEWSQFICSPFHITLVSHFSTANIQPFRLKSTNLQRKPKSDLGSIEYNGEKIKHETSLDHVSSLKLKDVNLTKRKSATEGDLITQTTLEQEENSKRRYEKEDPPEEERHKDSKKMPHRAVNKALVRTDFFDNMKAKNKETFSLAIELFGEHDIHHRGHVEFIYAALKEMKKFGVHKDLDAYKKIIDVFPKGTMIQTNMFQVEFLHYPKQQQCAIDVLEQMEDNGVIPDSEYQQMLTNIFGSWSFPMRKAGRMLYWMPKFKNLSPWFLPDELPDNALELAKLAVARMTSIDPSTKITTYDCAELEDAYDMTWIVSGQSADQQKLIEMHPVDRPIYVEGAFRVWLRNVCMNYFILRAEPKQLLKKKEDPDDVGNLHSVYEEEFLDNALEHVPSVHEQEDGVILGVCCTGSSSRDSIVSWIRFLEQTNPRLGKDISILFTLKSPVGPTDDLEILSYRDIDELQKLGKPRDPFSEKLGLDPGMPDMRQVGIWTDSESKFPNWPHHFHAKDSVSAKNRLENERIIQDIERQVKSRPEEIGKKSDDDKVDKKQIE